MIIFIGYYLAIYFETKSFLKAAQIQKFRIFGRYKEFLFIPIRCSFFLCIDYAKYC